MPCRILGVNESCTTYPGAFARPVPRDLSRAAIYGFPWPNGINQAVATKVKAGIKKVQRLSLTMVIATNAARTGTTSSIP